jgi:hypothetical protein
MDGDGPLELEHGEKPAFDARRINPHDVARPASALREQIADGPSALTCC